MGGKCQTRARVWGRTGRRSGLRTMEATGPLALIYTGPEASGRATGAAGSGDRAATRADGSHGRVCRL